MKQSCVPESFRGVGIKAVNS